MNIVVFGGSFNPIHTGHAMIASAVAQIDDVDQVWLMVSPQNPLKANDELLPEELRYKLAHLVAKECRSVVCSDFEFNLPRPSFTYNTLCRLKEAYPQHNFRLLIGSDNWKIFDRWRDWKNIISEYGVLVYQRPDAMVAAPFPEGVTLLDNLPMMLISSSYIRKQMRDGKDIRFLVPDVVYNKLEYGRK